MNTLDAIARRLRDIAATAEKANEGIHPVMALRVLTGIPTDLHTCANNLYQATNCGIGPDGDITLALTLATAHQEHRRGDLTATEDRLLEALSYVQAQRQELAR